MLLDQNLKFSTSKLKLKSVIWTINWKLHSINLAKLVEDELETMTPAIKYEILQLLLKKVLLYKYVKIYNNNMQGRLPLNARCKAPPSNN